MNTEICKETIRKEIVTLSEREAILKYVVNEQHEIIREFKNDPHWGLLKRVISDNIICDDIVKTVKYPFKEVDTSQLEELRKSGIPGFVLKEYDTYYYAEIEKDIQIPLNLLKRRHKCDDIYVCQRLTAASDKNGGCGKVRAYSRCIERFDWITLGYETFNTANNDVFFVGECMNYIKANTSKKVLY